MKKEGGLGVLLQLYFQLGTTGTKAFDNDCGGGCGCGCGGSSSLTVTMVSLTGDGA